MAGFSFGGIIAGLVAARLGRRVRVLVLLGPGGMGLAGAQRLQLLKILPKMVPADIERVHSGNLRILMIADPSKVDELAVFLQIDLGAFSGALQKLAHAAEHLVAGRLSR